MCTDKTGTLTRNEMQVVRVWTPAGGARVTGTGYEPTGEIDADADAVMPALRTLARAGVRCSSGRAVRSGDRWVAEGNPMEAALHTLALRVSADASGTVPHSARRFPFDPRRRRMSVVVDGTLLVKGAPDSVVPRCVGTLAAADTALARFSAGGLRVLAIARRRWDDDPAATADRAERDLELLGLVGLEDPPRPAAADAVAACRAAGVKVAMITGDHPTTASAIAREVGLAGADARALTSGDLPDDLEHLGALVDRDGVVIARVTPEDKLRIASALQRRGHVVAMTGDGVNDGPALRAADIGVAMGRSGTDVAREAADLVLLDDDFATIVAAIEHGRATFANIRRFLATMVAAGWRPGLAFPGDATLQAASGATFAAVVIGQTANAFACRSDTRWVGTLDWQSNRLLLVAVLIELAITAVFLFVPAIAAALGHAPPDRAGWVVALLTAPAVIAVDALDKRLHTS